MAVVTSSLIKDQILAGTYPESTLANDNVFDFPQYVRRRKYPSCEIELTQPLSSNETQKSTEKTITFVVRYYVRNLGVRSNEIESQTLVENVILSQLESLTLQDHKVTLETKTWKRNQFQQDKDHPAFTVSELTIRVVQVILSTATQNGILKFINSGSSIDNPPGSDYEFMATDVDIMTGYNDIDESITTSYTKLSFTGDFTGRIICNITVRESDLGITGEKLNNLITVRDAYDEKPIMVFTYTDKTNDATPSPIVETFLVEPQTLQRLYRYNDTVVFRLIGKIRFPSTFT